MQVPSRQQPSLRLNWGPRPAEPETVLRTLTEHGVLFVVVGASAAALRGAGPPARSIDLCYYQQWTNCDCLCRALEQLDAVSIPRPPVPIPLLLDLRQTHSGMRVMTRAGAVTLLPTVNGLGCYEEVVVEASTLRLGDLETAVLTRDQLTRSYPHQLTEDDPVARLLALSQIVDPDG